MGKTVLITGGAGFIGSHLADELLDKGYTVRALDNLCEQVHGRAGRRPSYLDKRVELIQGDVRDARCANAALEGVDAVFHFAARVGVGQSMYRVADYVSVNSAGTATLLEAIIERPVERLIVASSMSVYGEGLYQDANGNCIAGAERSREQLEAHRWELEDSHANPLKPIATPESKQTTLASVYALSKYTQERLCLLVGQAYGIPTVALRFFNVYGPRQALSNPYTGVLAIFASRLLNGKPPMVFEDGRQRRDFVHVRDVARACRLALETQGASGQVLNIGSGKNYSVLEIAELMARAMKKEEITPEVTGRYRVGDIRHCFADITAASRVLGYQASVDLAEGLCELSGWLQGEAAVDRVEEAERELAVRGLTV